MVKNIVHLPVVSVQYSQHQVLSVHLIPLRTVSFLAAKAKYVVDMLKWILHVYMFKLRCKSTHIFGIMQEFRQLFYSFNAQ